MKTDRTRGHLDLILLGALCEGPAHGYAIISALRERTAGVLDLAEGSVYPALHRLEDLGRVASEWAPSAGRRRRKYCLTIEGRKALLFERNEWSRLRGAIDALLTATPSLPGGRVVGELT